MPQRPEPEQRERHPNSRRPSTGLQFGKRILLDGGQGIIFLAEPCNLHQAQLHEQSLVGRLPYLAVELRQTGDGPEQELDFAGARLRAVSFEQRSGHLDEPQRFGPLGHQQIAHVAVEPGHEGLARESVGEHLVESDERPDVIAREQHIGDAEISVVVQHVERLGHAGGIRASCRRTTRPCRTSTGRRACRRRPSAR